MLQKLGKSTPSPPFVSGNTSISFPTAPLLIRPCLAGW